VVILCETRAWELTADEFFGNVMAPLQADLALCVGANEREVPNPFYDAARYVWQFPEPEDWGDAYEAAVGSRDWEALLTVHEQFFGGVDHAECQNVGSGAIIMFFRYLLRLRLTEEGLLDEYDWIIVTRSDFRWPTVHPPVDCFDRGAIHVLDGEQWGGVSDRYVAIPKNKIRSYLEIVDPIFTEPVELAQRLRAALEGDESDYKYFNPEKFLAFRMRELGIWADLRWLPYVPFAVRLPGAHTRWSEGELNAGLGYYVKYADEYRRAQIVSKYIHSQADWRRYFSRIRGRSLRRDLDLELSATEARQ
jgi:hypothetical protein